MAESLERAQHWLGTLVSIRVDDLPRLEAGRAIDAAFREIARIHRLMSYHDAASDVSRLNRRAHREPQRIDPDTGKVLFLAREISQYSDGAFDITTARELLVSKALPKTCDTQPSNEADWKDIELLSDNRVAFRKPLVIDLSGIAKGFAVDRAMERLRDLGVRSAAINAGGDLRVIGAEEDVLLDVPDHPGGRPVVRLSDGALAGSYRSNTGIAVHVCGQTRRLRGPSRFACVAAESCIIADALTKVVLSQGQRAQPTLDRFGATGCFYDDGGAWTYFNGS